MTQDLPRDYDTWKTTNPNDQDLEGDTDPDCTCARTYKSRRNCPVHGIDPDQAYDEWRDRQMERGEAAQEED